MRFQHCVKVVLLLVSSAAFFNLITDNADGAIHKYLLSNHPSGGIADPTYGFRLDALQGNVSEEYTFSFDHADAKMYLTYDDVLKTIEIAGKAFGGEDIGGSYDPNNSGLFDIKFTYTVGVSESAGGLIVTPEHDDNDGTIKFHSGNWQGDSEYQLTDYQGGHSESFLFLPDGHRISGDTTTMVGRGWVNHDGNGTLSTHDKASDWLFKGEIVPEPVSLCVWGTLAMLGSTVARRRGNRR